MMASSRISRWTGNTDLADLEMRLPQDAASNATERAGAALRIAAAALAAANARLNAASARRRRLSWLETAVGVIGLSGLATLAEASVRQGTSSLVAMFTLAAAVPLCVSLRRAATNGQMTLEETAAVETARTVERHAEGLLRALEASFEEPGRDSAADTLAHAMLLPLEQAAAALPGRENRQKIDADSKGRRHVRIKPDNDRVAIVTEAGFTMIAQLVDVSLSGAAIAGNLPDVRVGDQIRIGSRAANVVRAFSRGFACEFLEALPVAAFASDIVL